MFFLLRRLINTTGNLLDIYGLHIHIYSEQQLSCHISWWRQCGITDIGGGEGWDVEGKAKTEGLKICTEPNSGRMKLNPASQKTRPRPGWTLFTTFPGPSVPRYVSLLCPYRDVQAQPALLDRIGTENKILTPGAELKRLWNNCDVWRCNSIAANFRNESFE